MYRLFLKEDINQWKWALHAEVYSIDYLCTTLFISEELLYSTLPAFRCLASLQRIKARWEVSARTGEGDTLLPRPPCVSSLHHQGPGQQTLNKHIPRDFPGVLVVQSLLCGTGDAGLGSGPGTRIPQPTEHLSLCAVTSDPTSHSWSPGAATESRYS